MNRSSGKLIVFYDGSCPVCIRDRRWYEKLAGRTGESVEWLDITGRDEELLQQGIHPDKALRELHVKDAQGQVHREIDAYILLMSRVTSLKPLAWLIALPVVRPILAWLYHRWVAQRLLSRV
ncbi:thiol-disulfide oxidoreductase DCC family protein [Marinobacter gelidimuriae]|jgi:predicted DCC family thiol-disulfide oxidoreductase YuxK|uniref:thiol-disulfide oxidoreductase DCC family protein n=1 Tax=Marinobacter gelidimuriae TaxID=2739064 RepID=UPI0003A2F2A2|nr:DUF393 domain-containing protein [Marinobacter gelidimuriae]